MQAERLADSLVTLRDEIWSRWPKTTVWDKGDPAHAATWSDHNPNSKGVICAIDVLANGGMSLPWFAKTIVRVNPPALKYVIWNRSIWFPGYDWSEYNGSNPHSTHVHASVGWGPDGRSTGPYDDTTAWGIEGNDMDPRDLLRLMSETVIESSSLGPNRLIDLVKQPLQVRKDVEVLTDMVEGLLQRPSTAEAIVHAMANNPQILSALTSAMRDQLPLIPTAREIAQEFVNIITDNARNSRNGGES